VTNLFFIQFRTIFCVLFILFFLFKKKRLLYLPFLHILVLSLCYAQLTFMNVLFVGVDAVN